MELIAGILGMIICWRGRAYKEIRLFFASFAMQVFAFLYFIVFVNLVIPYLLLPHVDELGPEVYASLTYIFLSLVSLLLHGISYGLLLLGIYRIIKRLRNNLHGNGVDKQ